MTLDDVRKTVLHCLDDAQNNQLKADQASVSRSLAHKNRIGDAWYSGYWAGVVSAYKSILAELEKGETEQCNLLEG